MSDAEWSVVHEVLRACEAIGARSRVLSVEVSAEVILRAFAKFRPGRVTGHVSIGHDSDAISVDDDYDTAEHVIAPHLATMPVFMIFDQSCSDGRFVVEISPGSAVFKIFLECWIFECFILTGDSESFMAVNWYVVEVSGSLRHLCQPAVESDY